MSPTSLLDPSTQPSQEILDDWIALFNALNWRLFNDALPYPHFSFKCQAGSFGFYRPESYNRSDGPYCGEIVMNPAYYIPDDPKPFVATFVHQLVHHWQYYFGSPGKIGYHNREWADQMLAVGLQPTQDNTEGGREIGYTMHQRIIGGGALDRVLDDFMTDRQILRWRECFSTGPHQPVRSVDAPNKPALKRETGQEEAEAARKSVGGKRYRFTCPVPDCQQSADSFRAARLDCGIHKQPLVPTARKRRGLPHQAVQRKGEQVLPLVD